MMNEQLVDVVMGDYGEEQSVLSTGVPIYRGRHQLKMLLSAESRTCDEKGNAEMAMLFKRLSADFGEAPVGDILNGLIRRWKAVDGTERFAGIIPTGADYRDAGKLLAAAPPASKADLGRLAAFQPTPSEPRRTRPAMPTTRPEPRPTETRAERIARKMAKSALDTATKGET